MCRNPRPNPQQSGGAFSIKKHYDTLRSRGVPVGKDTLHDYLGFREDAFLVRMVSMQSESERQRMVNPRKAYPVDPGLSFPRDLPG